MGTIAPELKKLFAKRIGGVKPGLDRINKAVAEIDDLGLDLPSVLIGGTNGKGSTSGMLWHMLAIAGVKAGLFTSPHLCSFSERIQIVGQTTTDADLVSELEKLKGDIPADTYESLSFFEVSTLLGLRYFKRRGSQFNVLEVGVGGRWDSTNIANPLASAVISVGLDHQNYLGNTYADIAREKAGITRSGRPLFWGEPDKGSEVSDSDERGEAKNVVAEIARERDAIFLQVGKDYGCDSGEVYIRVDGIEPVSFSLPAYFETTPPFIRENFCTSLAMFYWLLHQDWAKNLAGTPIEIVKSVLAEFADAKHPWPPCMMGRFQRLKVDSSDSNSESNLLIDVCHNINGVEEFKRSLKTTGLLSRKKLPGVVSILADKEVNRMVDSLREFLEPLYLFRIDYDRTFCRDDLAERHKDLLLFDSFSDAWEKARNEPSSGDRPIVVCGSVYAVGDVLGFFKVPSEGVSASFALKGSNQ